MLYLSSTLEFFSLPGIAAHPWCACYNHNFGTTERFGLFGSRAARRIIGHQEQRSPSNFEPFYATLLYETPRSYHKPATSEVLNALVDGR